MWLMERYSERHYLSREQMQLIEDALGSDVLAHVGAIVFKGKLAAAIADLKRLVGSLPNKRGDERWPGWRKTITVCSETLNKHPDDTEVEPRRRFTEHLKEAAALVAELGRPARKNNMGINNDRLASWLVHLRWDESCGRLSIERVQRLDHILPGWRKEDILDEQERRWQNALVAYIARVKELGRLPTGLDPCATWMLRQRRAFKQGRLYEGRERALNDAMPGWEKFSRRRGSEQRTDERETTNVPAMSEQAGI